MAGNTGYERLHPLPELKGSLLLKYRLAKALTLISLLAIVSMAIYSIFNPNIEFVSDKQVEKTTTTTTAAVGTVEDKAQPDTLASYAAHQNGKCYLPNEIKIRKSEDGTYTPPSPHHSLLRAVHFASNEEYQEYCQQYDTILDTFSDAWPYNQNGECGNWQDHYTAMHKKNMEKLHQYQDGTFPDQKDTASIEDRPRFVSYICKEVPKDSNRGCGGLADRMGGMISTFFYALLTDRAYLLNWAPMNPLPLEAVWERPHIDWSHDPEEMEFLFSDTENPYLGYQKVDTLNKKLKVMTSLMFPDGGDTDLKDLWNGTYVEVRSNRGYIIQTFKQSPKYRKLLNDMGLTKQNTFRCLTNFLFQPTTGSRRFLNAYKRLFEMDSVLSIGIQIRTDDNALANPQNDLNTMEKWSHFFKCAGELAAYKKQPHHRHIVFFLVTDSHHLREEFVGLNDNKEAIRQYFGGEVADIASLVITGLPIEHIEPDQIAKYIHVEDPKAVNLERMLPGVNSAYMENWLLGETQYRVISIQGYGKMASFYSGEDKTSISMPKPSLKYDFPVCNTEDVFTTFDWLSTQWSLG